MLITKEMQTEAGLHAAIVAYAEARAAHRVGLVTGVHPDARASLSAAAEDARGVYECIIQCILHPAPTRLALSGEMRVIPLDRDGECEVDDDADDDGLEIVRFQRINDHSRVPQ